jgi:hypothetical protein
VSFSTYLIHIEHELTEKVLNSEMFDANTRSLGQANVSHNVGFFNLTIADHQIGRGEQLVL